MLYVIRFYKQDGTYQDTVAMPEVPMEAINNTMSMKELGYVKYEIIEKTEKEADEELYRLVKEARKQRKSSKRPKLH